MEETMKVIDKARSGGSVNSQHLFALGSAAIGYAACFDTALAMTAQRMKKAITSSTTSAKLAIGRIGDKRYVLGIDLYVEVRGLPGDGPGWHAGGAGRIDITNRGARAQRESDRPLPERKLWRGQ
jgi:hypothetical protein